MRLQLGLKAPWPAGVLATCLLLWSSGPTHPARALPTSPGLPIPPGSLPSSPRYEAMPLSYGSNRSMGTTSHIHPAVPSSDLSAPFTRDSGTDDGAVGALHKKRVNEATPLGLTTDNRNLGNALLSGGTRNKNAMLQSIAAVEQWAREYWLNWSGPFLATIRSLNEVHYWTRLPDIRTGPEVRLFQSPNFQYFYRQLLVVNIPGGSSLMPAGPNTVVKYTNDRKYPSRDRFAPSRWKWPSLAQYDFIINPLDGIITIISWDSPWTIAQEAGVEDAKLPEPQAISDILASEFNSQTANYNFWKQLTDFGPITRYRLLGSRLSLRYIVTPDVDKSYQTAKIVAECLAGSYGRNIPNWPGVTFDSNDPCFLYLLGTYELGTPIATFFAQHKRVFGVKTLESVKVFSLQNADEPQLPTLVWKVVNVPAQSQGGQPQAFGSAQPNNTGAPSYANVAPQLPGPGVAGPSRFPGSE